MKNTAIYLDMFKRSGDGLRTSAAWTAIFAQAYPDNYSDDTYKTLLKWGEQTGNIEMHILNEVHELDTNRDLVGVRETAVQRGGRVYGFVYVKNPDAFAAQAEHLFTGGEVPTDDAAAIRARDASAAYMAKRAGEELSPEEEALAKEYEAKRSGKTR